VELDLATLTAIRAKALSDGFIVLQAAIADDVLELLGPLPEHIKVITLVDYSQP
jgi:hypothetical protein